MDSQGGTITWYLTANDADFNAAMMRTRTEAKRTGRAVDREIGKGTKSARVSLEDFRRDLSRSAQLFRDFQIALRGFQMTSVIVGVTVAAGAIIELVGALTAATGAIYVLPALGATVAGVFATMKTATYGMGDAMSAVADGDAKKLAEAMEKLSPAAQEFVKSFGKVNEAFAPIRTAVQDALFAGLGKELEDVATASLPIVKDGMIAVATALNGVAKQAAAVAQEPFFQGMLARSFALAEENAIILGDAIRPLAMAFASLVEIGAPYTTMLSEWIVMQSELLAIYLTSEEGIKNVTGAIELSIDAMQMLGRFIGSIFGLFTALFRVSNQEGLSLVGTLTDIVNSMTDWVNSAEGTELLTALFQAANTILKEVAETAGEFILGLLQIIKAYNDLDGPLKDIITNMIVWSVLMSPIITYVSAVAASWRLVFFAGREAIQFMIWGIPQTIKHARLARQAITDMAEGFNDSRKAASGFTGIAGTIGGAVNTGLTSVMAGFTALKLGMSGAMVASGGLMGIIGKIGLALRAAFITSPIGWVVLALTGLVAGFMYLWNNVEGFRNFWIGLWDGIKVAAQAVGEWFAGPFVQFFAGVWEGIKAGAQSVADFFVGVWNGIVSAVQVVVDVFTTIGNIITGVLVGGFNILAGAISAVVNFLTPLWQIIGLVIHAFVAIGQIIWTVVSTAFNVLWTIISTLVQIIGVIFIGTLMKLGELITWVFNGAVSIITAAFTIIQGVFTTVWGAIVAFFTPIITAIGQIISTVFNAIKDTISSVLNTVWTVITTIFNAVSGFITMVWNGIWNFISPILNRIAEIFSSVFNAIARTVNHIFGLIKQYIINPISEVVNFVGRTIGQIATFIGNAVTNAYNSVRDFVGRFTSAGHDIINGIVNGIRNSAGKVTEFIKNVCKDALGAVKSFFGIKSPSRVMAKMFGYVMEGGVKGIDDHRDALVSAAQSAATGVMGAFGAMSASVGGMESDFSVTGTASGAYGVSLAPGAIDSPDTIGTGATGAVIYQTNEVHTDLDMDQVNRNLTWELGKL